MSASGKPSFKPDWLALLLGSLAALGLLLGAGAGSTGISSGTCDHGHGEGGQGAHGRAWQLVGGPFGHHQCAVVPLHEGRHHHADDEQPDGLRGDQRCNQGDLQGGNGR